MSYGDGGFYFLQPVGNGYGGMDAMLGSRRRGFGSMGASRGGSATDVFTSSQFKSIVKKFESYTKSLYDKAWGYAVLTPERKAAEEKWVAADKALGQLKVMQNTLASAKWKYADLPSVVTSSIGSWILSDVLKVSSTSTSSGGSSVKAATIPKVLASVVSVPKTKAAARSRVSPLAPGSSAQTLAISPPSTMGPQAAATTEEVAVAQAQADLSQQAAQTVSAATAAAGGTGITGFLSSTTGKVVVGAAAAGGAYLLWKNRRRFGFGS